MDGRCGKEECVAGKAAGAKPGLRPASVSRGFLILLVFAALVAFGCSSNSGSKAAQSGSSAGLEPGSSYSISLGFAGDICLADNYVPMERLASIGSDDIADGIDRRFIDLMRGVDLMWINNEFCYSTRGEGPVGKMWTFRANPENVKYLGDLGVDIVGLANNHAYDYGWDAFIDTLTTLEDAGIPYVGAGRNLSAAKAPVYLEKDGITIAYVAASRAEIDVFTPEAEVAGPGILWCYDDTLFLESISIAAERADYVIALPHWGIEYSTDLEDGQIASAHAYIDAGADAVIGSHPHILQGMEYYKGKPIIYSLGNFWFDDNDIDTLVAEIRIEGTVGSDGTQPLDGAEIELVLHPGTQSGVFTAWADTDEWRDRIFRHLEDISTNIVIDDDGVVHAA